MHLPFNGERPGPLPTHFGRNRPETAKSATPPGGPRSGKGRPGTGGARHQVCRAAFLEAHTTVCLPCTSDTAVKSYSANTARGHTKTAYFYTAARMRTRGLDAACTARSPSCSTCSGSHDGVLAVHLGSRGAGWRRWTLMRGFWPFSAKTGASGRARAVPCGCGEGQNRRCMAPGLSCCTFSDAHDGVLAVHLRHG